MLDNENANTNHTEQAMSDDTMHNAVGQWYAVNEQLKDLKKQERELRDAIIRHYFAGAEVGSHNIGMPQGWKLTGTIKLSRTVDAAALDALSDSLSPEVYTSVFDFKPFLVAKAYSRLSDDQRHLVDQCLIIKEAAPTLKLTPPKK